MLGIVMAALEAAIQSKAHGPMFGTLDGRVKPGHDGNYSKGCETAPEMDT